MLGRTKLRSLVLLTICLLGSPGMAVEPNPLNANEQIAFYLIESQIADRLIELEDELGPMVELSLYITIEGDDPSRALLTALRKLGVRAYSGSGHYPGYGMHFTFKVLAVLSLSLIHI